MIRLDDAHLLMIEPDLPSARDPIVDDITRTAAALLRAAKSGKARYRGMHFCTGAGCNAISDNTDHVLVDADITTNSLAVHYVACHRDEVPASEIEKLLALGITLELQPVEPTQEQLTGRRDHAGSGRTLRGGGS